MSVLDQMKRLNDSKSSSESTAQNTRMISPCYKGDSGTAGTGIDLTGDYTPAFPVKILIAESETGNIGFETDDGNSHVIPASVLQVVDRIVITKIYSSTDANYATTATGIHVFGG